MQQRVNHLLHNVVQEQHLAKNSILKEEGIMEKNSMSSTSRVYESVDDKSLPWDIYIHKFDGKQDSCKKDYVHFK